MPMGAKHKGLVFYIVVSIIQQNGVDNRLLCSPKVLKEEQILRYLYYIV